MNTRTIRNEKILPNVKKMTKQVNGTNQPLTPEEQYSEVCKAFKTFFEQHTNYGGGFGFFYGVREDFFTPEMLKRILNYGSLYFNDCIKRIETGQYKITSNPKEDIRNFRKLYAFLQKAVDEKSGEVEKNNRRMRKAYPHFVARICATNAEYLTNKDSDIVLTAV